MFNKVDMKANMVAYDANTSGFTEEKTNFCYFVIQKIRLTFKYLNAMKAYFQLHLFY